MSSPNNTKIVKTSINEDGILRIILDNPKIFAEKKSRSYLFKL